MRMRLDGTVPAAPEPTAVKPIFDSAVLQVIESARQFAPRRQRGTTRSGAAISLR
jgi:hypothetical protein